MSNEATLIASASVPDAHWVRKRLAQLTLIGGASMIRCENGGSLSIAVDAVNERSTSWLSFSFADRDSEPVVPISVAYRIDCQMTGTVIVPLTRLWDFAAIPAFSPIKQPSSVVEIELTPSINRLIDQHNSSELREVTLEALFGGDRELRASSSYSVSSLRNVK